MKIWLLGAAILFTTGLPAAASSGNESHYQTPEYSGPSAKFDTGQERYRQDRMKVQDAITRQQRQQTIRQNDLSVDRKFDTRLRQVQSEMDRRRDEVRRTYYND